MRRPLILGLLAALLPSVPTSLINSIARPPASNQTPTPKGNDNAPMVRVEAGPFTMGSNSGGDPDERPSRTVDLPAFWIDVHEVTNAQYKRFCDETGRKAPVQWTNGAFPAGQAEWPVVNVTWEDAAAYARWAGKRLPTEQEWEKAARGTDGRAYPWGAEADKAKAAIGDEKALGAVGRFPAGASPYGCLDMAGNAWEWTADWYGPYAVARGNVQGESGGLATQDAARGTQRPNNPPTQQPELVMTAVYSPVSVHYGRKYKVIRGGGAIEYYGIPNTGRAADRARGLPFAGYDGTGFRCALSDGAPPASLEPKAEAEQALASATQAGQRRTAPASPVLLNVTEPSGTARVREVVTSGVPFPQGALKSPLNVKLTDEKGAEVALQVAVTTTWKDKSIKWLLLDFPCSVGGGQTRRFKLWWGPNVRPKAAPAAEKKAVDEFFLTQPGMRSIDLDVDGKRIQQSVVASGEKSAREISFDYKGRTVRKERIDRADWVTETFASLFALSARTSGPVGGKHQWTAYNLRQLSDKQMQNVTRWDITAIEGAEIKSVVFGGGHKLPVKKGDTIELVQETEYRYSVLRNGRRVAGGARAPGWLMVNLAEGAQTVAVRDFWQQFPMALTVQQDNVKLRAWASKQPLEFDRGMAKTVEILTAEGAPHEQGGRLAAAFQQPLFAIATPEWYCRSGALGDLWPYDLNRFPAYETPVEADFDRWIRNRPYGWRNWGDAYMGGPYKGKNAYNNLEYDVPYNFAMQFARTGHRKYLEAMAVAARHQSDIDTNHVSGQPWKHGPRHTETPAELGHVFLRGLIAYSHLTGDTRGVETAKEIATWISRAIRRSSETGNERQIGWALYALTAAYEATWDAKLLEATKEFVDTLVEEQSPTGKFDIRYDNRIAFFNGLAMSGLRSYYELTGDEKVLTAIRRLADRTLGMYPEYAGRTIDGYTWLFEKTGDRRYLTAAVRSWETSLEYGQARDWGPGATLFTTRYLPFAVRNGLAPAPSRPLKLSPAQLATHNGLYLTRIESPSATVHLTGLSSQPGDIVVIRHGAHSMGAVGAAPDAGIEKRTPARSRQGQAFPLMRGPEPAQRADVAAGKDLSAGWKVVLHGPGTKAWDVITTQPARRMIAVDGKAAGRLVPRIFFVATGPALTATFDILGEGFHGATLYDPAGKPFTATGKFIDQGDEKKYTITLKATIPAGLRNKVWSMEIRDAALSSLTGAKRQFSTTRAAHPVR